jgi:prepilin-type N-terminal cleavage/methylation domain-containing protein
VIRACWSGVLKLWDWVWDNIIELLIVVAIIGIIAAITLPAIIADKQTKATAVQDDSIPFFMSKYRVEGGWLYRDGAGMAFVPDPKPCQLEAAK